MRKISVLLGLFALFVGQLALAANNAVVTAATGSVQAQTGTAAPRVIRVGDELSQGDTVITGPQSTAVLKFDDGQITALTGNSRLTITTYRYDPATQSGSSLLSLVAGGMRAITGALGKRNPNQVAFRAATATIGIRGTDFTLALAGSKIVGVVKEGRIEFRWKIGDQEFKQEISAGQGLISDVRTGTVTTYGAEVILARLADAGPDGVALANLLGGLGDAGLANAINAASNAARQGGDDNEGDRRGPPGGPPPGGPPGNSGGGGQCNRNASSNC